MRGIARYGCFMQNNCTCTTNVHIHNNWFLNVKRMIEALAKDGDNSTSNIHFSFFHLSIVYGFCICLYSINVKIAELIWLLQNCWSDEVDEETHKIPELGTFGWWITGLMLDPLFFLISRLNNAGSPLYIDLQINLPIRIKDIPF